jgi:hypothetical protein
MTHRDTDTPLLPEQPEYRPVERFWPYAELAEQPSEEELARLHPELRAVLFGAPVLPFSISLAFPAFAGDHYARAVTLARASDEYVEFETAGVLTHRARFYPGARAVDLRDLYELVNGVPGNEVLVDDRAVPYARELWLPLVWFLIR